MFVLIKGNGPAVYLAVYLTAGSNKQLSILPYYCPPRWRLTAYQQISNPALLSRIYMFRNIRFRTPKPIKLANMHFETNKLRMVMSCNCNGSHRSSGKCYNNHLNQSPMRPIVFGLFGPRGRSDLGAFWPPSSPSPYVSLDTFSQAKVVSVPGKRELTVPAREAPPTVETYLMELDMYFVGLLAS